MKKRWVSKLLAMLVGGMVMNAYAEENTVFEKVVVKGGSDSIEKILDELDWDYKLIDSLYGYDPETWSAVLYDLSGVKQLYLNCGALGGEEVIAHVKEWVEKGGYLYASDLTSPFMEVWGLEFKNDGTTGHVMATIEDAGLKNYIGSELVDDKLPIYYNAGSWARITNLADATVLLRGDAPTGVGIVPDSPLAVTFRVGKGRVLFTTFHNAPGGNLQPGMKRAVEYFATLPDTQASADKLLTSHGLDPNSMVGVAMNTLEEATKGGVEVQGIPAGLEGKYLFQVTETLLGQGQASSSGGYTVQLLNSQGTVYETIDATGNKAVIVDVPAADNNGEPWTFKILNSTGYARNQSVIAVSWQGPIGQKPGAGDGGPGGVSTGGGNVNKAGNSSGCNKAAGPFGFVALLALAAFMLLRRKPRNQAH